MHQNKLLESENKMLLLETDQPREVSFAQLARRNHPAQSARQELKLLGDNVEQCLLREEGALAPREDGQRSSPDSKEDRLTSEAKARYKVRPSRNCALQTF